MINGKLEAIRLLTKKIEDLPTGYYGFKQYRKHVRCIPEVYKTTILLFLLHTNKLDKVG